jgi:hypothetical protein
MLPRSAQDHVGSSPDIDQTTDVVRSAFCARGGHSDFSPMEVPPRRMHPIDQHLQLKLTSAGDMTSSVGRLTDEVWLSFVI